MAFLPLLEGLQIPIPDDVLYGEPRRLPGAGTMGAVDPCLFVGSYQPRVVRDVCREDCPNATLDALFGHRRGWIKLEITKLYGDCGRPSIIQVIASRRSPSLFSSIST